MLRLIALDLDGTLLDPDKTITQEALNQLRRTAAAGGLIAIATGRPREAAESFLCQAGLGSAAGFPHWLSCEERDLYQLAPQGYTPLAAWNDARYQQEAALLPTAAQLLRQFEEETQIPFYISNSVQQHRRGFIEILLPPGADIPAIEQHLHEQCRAVDLQPVRHNNSIALRHRCTGKERVLTYLAEQLGVKPDEILAVGDGHNDLGMLSGIFQAATTANAEPVIHQVVKRQGGYISRAGYSLGVAEIIAHYTALDCESF